MKLCVELFIDICLLLECKDYFSKYWCFPEALLDVTTTTIFTVSLYLVQNCSDDDKSITLCMWFIFRLLIKSFTLDKQIQYDNL